MVSSLYHKKVDFVSAWPSEVCFYWKSSFWWVDISLCVILSEITTAAVTQSFVFVLRFCFSCRKNLFFVFATPMKYTHRFNGPFSGTTRLSWYQKGKTNLDFTEVRESECRQWQQLGHIQVCTLLQADNHQHPTSQFFTGRMPFLPPNQQCESTDGKHDSSEIVNVYCSQPYEEYTRYWQITFWLLT